MNDTITITLPMEQAIRILEALETQISTYQSYVNREKRPTSIGLWKLMVEETKQAHDTTQEAVSEATADL